MSTRDWSSDVCSSDLLVTKADDRILARGAMRRHDPEREAHGERHAEGDRSEERRVGKERRSGLTPKQYKQNDNGRSAHSTSRGRINPDANEHVSVVSR